MRVDETSGDYHSTTEVVLVPYMQEVLMRPVQGNIRRSTVVVMTLERIENGPPIIERNPDGTLTRQGAVIEARKMWGDLGSISSDEDLPRLVWCIGQFDRTVGRGRTWEIALERSRVRKAKLDARIKADLERAQREIAS